MTDIAQAVTIAIGIALGIVVGWYVRGWFVSDERDRLRARLVDCESRLDAVTLHTMQRRQARAEASRKGWQTKRGKAHDNPALREYTANMIGTGGPDGSGTATVERVDATPGRGYKGA